MEKYLAIIYIIALFGCGDTVSKEEGYYPNGNLKYRNDILDGKNHGLAKSFYENGSLKFEGEFREGYRIGKHILYFEENEKPKEITYFSWKDTSSYLSKMSFYDENGIKTFESEFNPSKEYEIVTKECCYNDSTEFGIKLLNPVNEYVYVRIGDLDESFDFISDNRIVYGDSAYVNVKEECRELIQGMLFDWKIEFTSDTSGVTRAEHTYFSYKTNCKSETSL